MIVNRKRFNQFINYDKLTFGNIHPTDTDGEIEYHNKAWIFYEIKYKNTPVPLGQKITFERKVDDISKANKQAVYIIAEHDIIDTNQEVDGASCIVRCIYYKNQWINYKPKIIKTLKTVIKNFINFVDKNQK